MFNAVVDGVSLCIAVHLLATELEYANNLRQETAEVCVRVPCSKPAENAVPYRVTHHRVFSMSIQCCITEFVLHCLHSVSRALLTTCVLHILTSSYLFRSVVAV
jgi:hypothetical protein